MCNTKEVLPQKNDTHCGSSTRENLCHSTWIADQYIELSTETNTMGFGEEKKDEDLDLSFGGVSEDDSKGKIVKFAEVEAEKADAQLDQERSRQQLLSKIARLTETLNEAQQQVQEEKDKRKKKEKSLLKLAKELKKRNLVREKEEDRLEEVRYQWNDCFGKFLGAFVDSVCTKRFKLRFSIISSKRKRSIWSIIGFWHRKNSTKKRRCTLNFKPKSKKSTRRQSRKKRESSKKPSKNTRFDYPI